MTPARCTRNYRLSRLYNRRDPLPDTVEPASPVSFVQAVTREMPPVLSQRLLVSTTLLALDTF